MSVVNSALLPALENRLPKMISPRTHGVIDYAQAAFFLTVGLLSRKSNRRAANAAFATSAFILVQSLLTDYPLGVEPVIPFAVHGRMDVGFASASWSVPRLFGFGGTAAARIFEINSIIEATVVGMTDFNSERAREEKQPMHPYRAA